MGVVLEGQLHLGHQLPHGDPGIVAQHDTPVLLTAMRDVVRRRQPNGAQAHPTQSVTKAKGGEEIAPVSFHLRQSQLSLHHCRDALEPFQVQVLSAHYDMTLARMRGMLTRLPEEKLATWNMRTPQCLHPLDLFLAVPDQATRVYGEDAHAAP